MSDSNRNMARDYKVKDDGDVINEANYLSPEDNGGQVLVVPAAGIIPLVVPAGSIQATITNPVPVRIAFGVDASETVGTYFPEYSCPTLTSSDQLTRVSVWFSGAATGAYVQYWR